MTSVPEQPVDERDEADGVESSDDERRAREAEKAEAWERASRLALRRVYALIEARHARRIAAEQAEAER